MTAFNANGDGGRGNAASVRDRSPRDGFWQRYVKRAAKRSDTAVDRRDYSGRPEWWADGVRSRLRTGREYGVREDIESKEACFIDDQ
jgi:hypothetical protein